MTNYNDDKSIFLIRLADTLEDFSGHALFLRGVANDNASSIGGFENKLAYYKQQAENIIQQANDFEAPILGDVFKEWVFKNPYTIFPATMRRGQYSSYRIL